jgi:iron complex outermembrane recepter protein
MRESLLSIAIAGCIASSAYAETFQLEEIVVTAQKRAESLQDVPISVAATSGEKLTEAGIGALTDLSNYVPNLRAVEGAQSPSLFIRGIGSGNNAGFEQSVATYSDGIYVGRAFQSRASFMDLERVEVLRGPQGILFGKNSIAGAISLVSAKPTDEVEGKVSIKHEPEYNTTETNAFISGPLSDTVAARLAVRYLEDDGFYENSLQDRDETAVEDSAARLILTWDARDDLSATFKFEHSDIQRKGRQMEVADYGIYPLTPSGSSLQDDVTLNHKRRTNVDEENSYRGNLASVQLDWDVAGGTLTSLTTYTDYTYSDLQDLDLTEVPVVVAQTDEEFDQVSQEIRFVSPGGETVDYIIGAFYQESDQIFIEDAQFDLGNLDGATPQVLPYREFKQEGKSWAVFGQATWNITEEFRTTLGMRYAVEEKEGSRSQTTWVPAFNDSVENTPLAPAFLALYNWADHDGENALSGSDTSYNFTPSINVQYDINEDTMVYASFSTGYKSGGYDARGINGLAAGVGPITATTSGLDNFHYDDEKAETIELGAKMTLLDGAAELNAALFHTEYTDMQVSIHDGGVGFAVQNAGEARVQGLEMDGRWQLTESLMATASVAYLDFEWTDYQAGVCPKDGSLPASPTVTGNCDYTGKENVHTPEWSMSLGFSHSYMLSDALELKSALDMNFKDNHYTSVDLDSRQEQGAYTLVNARVALTPANANWEVALVGNNLTDREVKLFGANIANSNGGYTNMLNRPRTIAIEGSYSF